MDLAKAYSFVCGLYKDIRGKDGLYIYHLMRVAGRMKTEKEQTVALLHDSVEDNLTTLGIIEDKFGKDIAEAVDAISRRKDESYSEYITRVSKNDIARKVKIQDLIDNSNLARLETVTLEDTKRQMKYAKALQKLISME